ncbi:MAG: hypothetical protein ABJN52_04440 [Litorimonas sp.]
MSFGAVAYFGSRKIVSKWTGKRRKKKFLDLQEMRFVETCLMLATAFRGRAGQNADLDPITANTLQRHLRGDALAQLDICMAEVTDWPDLPRKKLEDHKVELAKLFDDLSSFESKKRRSHLRQPRYSPMWFQRRC